MNLCKLIYSVLDNRTEVQRTYIGASSIGNPCERAIWYGLNRPDEKEVTSKQRMTFEIGRQLEWVILDILERELHLCEPGSYFESSYPKFQGNVDSLILDKEGKPLAFIEIKTANDSSFNTFKNKGIKLWYPEYYDQIQSYMGMSGVHKCYLLALNKNTSELHQEAILFDEYRYDWLVNKARRIGEATSEPPRINNSASYFKCKMCFYKKICHEQDD